MDSRIKRLYWQLTALLLAVYLAGSLPALWAAIALNGVQALHFSWVRRSLRPLDVQVRWAYLGLLLLGSIGPLWPLHVVQFIGVNALLVAEYCLLARLLMLLPANRSGRPLSPGLLRWLLFVPPAPGGIQQRMVGAAPGL